MQIGTVKITPYLKASMKFCPHFIYFYSDLDKIWYRSPCTAARNCECRASRFTDSHTLFKGVKKELSIFPNLLSHSDKIRL